MLIGITGHVRADKEILDKYLKQGYIYINVWDVADKVLEENKYTLEIGFNSTDKEEIKERIFQDKALYDEFSSAIWKTMQSKIDNVIENNNVILDFTFLPYTKYWKDCYKILCKSNIEIEEKISITYNENEMDEICNM